MGLLQPYLLRVKRKKRYVCLQMLTVWLPMCSSVAPMARRGRVDITGNEPGQDITSSSTYTHVPGWLRCSDGGRRQAADGCLTVTFGERHAPSSSPFMFLLHSRTPYHPLSAAVKWDHEWRRTGCQGLSSALIGGFQNWPISVLKLVRY